ncbi:MAG: hypothetical protein LBQ88_08685 [Treponema sp.]|nr:hypothetical protein [Treponema sp.]
MSVKQNEKADDLIIVDHPVETESPVEKSVREMDIMETLLSGKAIHKNLETSRGVFTAQFPSGHDRLKIDQVRALRRRGIPAESFDDQADLNNNIWSTLDIVIVDGPDWYKKAKKNNPSWSWEEGPDEELILELYNLVRSFRLDIAEKIRQSKLGRPVEKIELTTDTAPVDDGAFSGLTNGPQGGKADR